MTVSDVVFLESSIRGIFPHGLIKLNIEIQSKRVEISLEPGVTVTYMKMQSLSTLLKTEKIKCLSLREKTSFTMELVVDDIQFDESSIQ
jgi:hypothetical protein